MTNLNSSSRLKAKRDTFFLPDSKGGVYLRNNTCSFQIEGNTIYQWLEKLMPLFNGVKTLGELTEGLTVPYRNRVFEIGEIMYKNGFVRDVSNDKPHQLTKSVMESYASQIEFIENFTESGAYRFQQFRQAKVLVIGCGEILFSMISSLVESGLPKLHVILSDCNEANSERLNKCIQNAKRIDIESEILELPFNKKEDWRDGIKPYDWILFISQDGNIEEIRELNHICKEERKMFLPAICFDHVGLAGPVFDPGSDVSWESAWRRIHHTAIQRDKNPQTLSIIAGAVLANVTVFELFKKVTGAANTYQSNQIYILDLETLEGDWVSFLPHPLITADTFTPKPIEDLNEKLNQESNREGTANKLLNYFSSITSEETGIFHLWEEQNLPQLPLSQCYVQAVNPLSQGPAELLPKIIAAGFNHEEAKKEAGLKGIEMYVSTMLQFPNGINEPNNDREFIGIGAGETTGEALCRGLQVYLEEKLKNRKVNPQNTEMRLQLGKIEDSRCRFYLNALKTLNGTLSYGMEENIFGFPVIWVKSNGRKYTKPGLNAASALRNALFQALFDSQNHLNSGEQIAAEGAVFLKTKESKLDVPSCENMTPTKLLKSSSEILKQNKLQLLVYDLAIEPFLMEDLAGVYGVQLREGDFNDCTNIN